MVRLKMGTVLKIVRTHVYRTLHAGGYVVGWVCCRFFNPTPQRHQMLAWALNPTFNKDKILGRERAAMCEKTAIDEIRRRQELSPAAIRPEPKEAASSQKHGAGLLQAAAEMMDWEEEDGTESGILDEWAIFCQLSKPEIKQAGRIDEGKDGTPRFCVLTFWSGMQGRLPEMAKIARSAYSVMATEANTERAFSASGAFIMINRKHRNHRNHRSRRNKHFRHNKSERARHNNNTLAY
jgi:hypothetical protein